MMGSKIGFSNSLFIFIVAISVARIAQFVYADEVSTLSSAEVKALTKLRLLVEDQLDQIYMKEDLYLIRFLRARKLNVENAADMLLKSLAWRKENKINDIVTEVVGVEKSAPYTQGSFDRFNRPVGVMRIGHWKIRRIVLSGEMNKMIRIIFKFQEELSLRVILASHQNRKNVSQAYTILDLSNFNARDHACLSCTPIALQLFNAYENYYPQGVYKIVAVNVPRIFESIWVLLRPAMSEATQKVIFFYGHDKSQWREELRKEIEDDQLPSYLGGTYIENPDSKEVLVSTLRRVEKELLNLKS